MPDEPDILGRRIAAALVDLVVLFVLLIVVGLLIGDHSSSGASVSVNLHGGAAVVFFVLALGYYAACEATTGQTLGKRLLGIRVVAADGGAPGTGRVLVRTLLRIVDVLPFLYFIGFVAVISTSQRRRLGDLAAGTRVMPA